MKTEQVEASKVFRAEKRARRKKIHILYLIPSLQTGGAEIQLLSLVNGLDKQQFDVTVAVFYRRGDLGREFESVKDISIV